jgi:hypothetical protein
MVVFVYVLICGFMIEKKMVKLWWRGWSCAAACYCFPLLVLVFGYVL